MNANNTIIMDIGCLGQEELVEEYNKLSKLYLNLKKISENDKQNVYELKRSLQTSTAAELYLSSELETIVTTNSKDLNEIKQKNQIVLDDLKNQNAVLRQTNINFEVKIFELENKVQTLENSQCNIEPNKNVTITDEDNNMEKELQKDNKELVDLIEEMKTNLNVALNLNLEYEAQIENLTEKVECLEDNLFSKKEELEEKSSQIESLTEKNFELSTELMQLKTSPIDQDKKGNSLFAEVDDQRKQMRQILLDQKKHYSEMKRLYSSGQNEIRRLKRENAVMLKDIEACRSTFLNADREYEVKLNERIQYMTKQNEILEKTLATAETNLVKLATEKGINWLDSMLSFSKKESTELKDQLYSCLIQKGLLDQTLRNIQQDLAKWRFEALQTRNILVLREASLEEHNIPFMPIKTIEYTASHINIENSTPILYSNISDNNLTQTPTNDKENISKINIEKFEDNVCQDEKLYNNFTKSLETIVSLNESIVDNENIDKKVPCKRLTQSPKEKNKLKKIINLTPTQTLSPKEQPTKSILTKEKGNFVKSPETQNNLKYVKFCESTIKKNDLSVKDEDQLKVNKTKSNVTVRRYVIKSKPTN